MGLFDNPAEQERKAKLKAMEDKRVAFAQKLAKEGFAPEKMLFAQTENGGFVALCRPDNRYCLIVSPGFGTDEDFQMEYFDAMNARAETVFIPSEGLGGIFGMGKKGQRGVEYFITRADGSEVKMPFVGGRTAWLECKLAKNPLLKTQRRRGDANVVWDLQPLDNGSVDQAVKAAQRFLPEVAVVTRQEEAH